MSPTSTPTSQPGTTTTPTSAATTSQGSSSTQLPLATTAQQAQNEFLQLLTAQLQNQDPLNPISDTDFVSQLAQFSTLQGVENVNTTLTSSLQLQQLTPGNSLIGQNVTYTAAGGGAVQSGVVTATGISNGQLQLTINGQTVPVANVTGIQQQTAATTSS